ncbi:hypothetical protein GW813_06000, partial [bacterium]|nr:hypothetical protein [bacterium]
MTIPARSLRIGAVSLLRESGQLFWTLAKILVPLSLVVRLLAQLGVVQWLGEALGPVMGVVGLPGVTGLVWATALFSGLYAAMVVFVAVAPQAGLVLQPYFVMADWRASRRWGIEARAGQALPALGRPAG